MSAPRVSIVIPTLNGGAVLRENLDAIAAQQGAPPFELIAADSGSTDGTRELLAARADRLLDVVPGEFDHGATRNQAIAAGRGELAVLLVQDAVPAGPGWLRELVRPLEADPTVAGSFARQVPRADASALTRCAHARWVAAGPEPRVAEPLGETELRALSPAERHLRCAFDNVCSCVRRAVWERHPFPHTPFAEDLAWGRAALLAGHRLAYAPEAAVIHSHERSARYELSRTYLAHRRLGELFGLRTIPGAPALLRAMIVSLLSHARCLLRAHGALVPPGQAARAVALAVAWPLGQYLGGRAAAEGRELLRVRGV